MRPIRPDFNLARCADRPAIRSEAPLPTGRGPPPVAGGRVSLVSTAPAGHVVEVLAAAYDAMATSIRENSLIASSWPLPAAGAIV